MKHTTKVAAICMLLIAGSYTGVAAIGLIVANGDVTSQTNSGFEVTFESVSTYPEAPFIDDETVRANGGTISSPGAADVDLPNGLDVTGNTTINVNTAGSLVTLDQDSNNAVGFQGDFNSVTVLEGIAANDGAADLTYTANAESRIDVGGLDPNQAYLLRDVNTGDVVAIGGSDGSGTATFSAVRSGTHTVEVADYVIELRDIKTGELVDNVSAEIRLYEEGTDTVFVRNTSDGRISTADLPATSAFSVTTRADGYIQRQTFIEDPRDQQTVYLLDNNTTTQLVRFNIEDRTGEFNDDVRIQIERSVNTTDSPPGEERYQIVAGDIVGSQLEFDTELERDVRYRISVSNAQGDERELGSFLIKTDQVIDLVISGIDVGYDRPDGQTQVNASQTVNDDTGDKTLRVVVQDPSRETTDVTVEVVDYANPDQVIDSGSTQGPVGEFSYSTTVSGADADKRLVANVTYTYQGEEISTTIPFGGNQYNLLPGLDPDWRAIFGVGFLLVLGGIFSVANARIGALIIPGAALALNLTGILTTVVTTTSVGLAFAVAVGINIIRGSGDTLR